MHLPETHETYSNLILKRSRQYISYGFWNGIEQANLLRWYKNFSRPEHSFLAALMLDNLVYRSNKQIQALLAHFLGISLPGIYWKFSGRRLTGDEMLLGLRNTDTEPKIRFLPSLSNTDPEHKSGQFIVRVLKKYFGIKSFRLLKVDDFEKSYDSETLFVFLDDFAGTGEQFIANLYEFREFFRSTIMSASNIIFHPLMVHRVAVQNIGLEVPSVPVHWVELLDSKNSFLATDSTACANLIAIGNELQDIKAEYLRILDHFGIVSDEPFGYGDLCLLLAFEDSSPDNASPLLWFQDCPQFHPLFNR